MKLQFRGSQVLHQINFTKEVFYLKGDENSNFDKVQYLFPLGFVDDFKNYKTLSLKILASKENNGELIGWLDNKKVFEIYGPNFTIGNGYTFKWGFYRWLKDAFLNETPTQSLTVKEFGYSEYSETMYKALKSKYIGRQMAGGGIITLAGLAAFNGKLTGAGDQDKNVRRYRTEMGTVDNYQLFGIDHRGWGPVSQLLTIVGTLAQNHDKIEPADMEEFFKITAYNSCLILESSNKFIEQAPFAEHIFW